MEIFESSKLSTRDAVLIPLFAALIAIGAFIRIPIGLVPASLQTVFVLLAGMLLGARRGSYAVLLYLLLGLVGLPVFTAGGGPQYVLHPTFGYLLGMVPAAFITGFFAQKTRRRKILPLFLGALLGLAFIYTAGLIWLYVIRNLYMGAGTPFLILLQTGVLIFLPSDLLWCLSAALVGKRMAFTVNRLS